MAKISLIVAIAGKKRVIGKDGKLPWYIPEELAHFKEITIGHPIIMGRKTYDSIGRVLPGRANIIITHDPDFKVEGAIIVHSLDEAIKIAQNVIDSTSRVNTESSRSAPLNDKNTNVIARNNVTKQSQEQEIFIIGGQQIFEQAMPKTDKIYLTVIDKEIDGDVFFPVYSEFAKAKTVGKGEHEDMKYTFLELER